MNRNRTLVYSISFIVNGIIFSMVPGYSFAQAQQANTRKVVTEKSSPKVVDKPAVTARPQIQKPALPAVHVRQSPEKSSPVAVKITKPATIQAERPSAQGPDLIKAPVKSK